MDQAREGAFRRLDSQKTRAASGLTAMVNALRQGARELGNQNATVTPFVEGAANQIERFVGGFKDKDLRTMVTDVEQFARRRPGVFVGGAFLLGLAAARFLKSSATPDEPWRSAAMPIQTDRVTDDYRTAGSGGGYGQGG